MKRRSVFRLPLAILLCIGIIVDSFCLSLTKAYADDGGTPSIFFADSFDDARYMSKDSETKWLEKNYDAATTFTIADGVLTLNKSGKSTTKSYYVKGGFSHLIHMTAAHLW